MTRRLAWTLALIALVAVLGAALLSEAQREVNDPGNSDSIAFIAGAHLVLDDPRHLYDPQAQTRVEADLLRIPVGERFLSTYTNIAAGAALLSPLAGYDLRTASALFASGSLLLFAFALMLMLRLLEPLRPRPLRALIAVAAVFCIPAADAIIQWDSLLTVAVLASALLAERRRCAWAGLLLSLLVLKPQVVWLVVPALVAARSWRYLAAFLIGAAGWLTVSVAISGASGLSSLAQLVLRQHVGEAGWSVGAPSLIASLTHSGTLGFVAGAGLGLLATLLLLQRRELLCGRPLAALAIGVPLSLLCSPHVNPQDLMLLALPIAFMARTKPRFALGLALSESAAAGIQLLLPPGARHLYPLLLLATVAAVARLFLSARTGDPAAARPLRVQPSASG
jgi:Glycosyltransferase family 87